MAGRVPVKRLAPMRARRQAPRRHPPSDGDFYQVQWPCCRIFSFTSIAAEKVGSGLLTTS